VPTICVRAGSGRVPLMGAESSSRREPPEAGAIERAAARWLARRDRGLSGREQSELAAWQAADPRNAEELRRLERAWREFDAAKSVPELVAMTDALRRSTSGRARRRVWARSIAFAAAAAVVVLAAGGAWWRGADSRSSSNAIAGPSYRVIASAADQMVLADGSQVDVRQGGEVRPDFTATERRVTLIRGEAHFVVASDVTRPFIVNVGSTAVRAVGTAFNVRLEADRVEVLVTEGKVQVARSDASDSKPESSPVVVAGERATIEREPSATPDETAAGVAVVPVASAEVEQALAWHSTRLVFDRTPLDEAVEAFNRHSPAGSGAPLVIGDPVLRTRRLGGTFRAANVDGFVRLLEQSLEVRTERRGEKIVLLAAP
jgi:transmembrane sensor